MDADSRVAREREREGGREGEKEGRRARQKERMIYPIDPNPEKRLIQITGILHLDLDRRSPAWDWPTGTEPALRDWVCEMSSILSVSVYKSTGIGAARSMGGP